MLLTVRSINGSYSPIITWIDLSVSDGISASTTLPTFGHTLRLCQGYYRRKLTPGGSDSVFLGDGHR
jgi:hypothetical protein